MEFLEVLLHVLSLLTANGPVFRVMINIRCLQELNTTASGTKTRDESIETALFGWKSGALTIRLEYRL